MGVRNYLWGGKVTISESPATERCCEVPVCEAVTARVEEYVVSEDLGLFCYFQFPLYENMYIFAGIFQPQPPENFYS